MRINVENRRIARLQRRAGAALVEAALVLPVVITFLFGILEYGRYLMMTQVITNAAREGAHYALSHSQPVVINGTTYGNATSDVANVVTAALGGQSLSGQTIQVYASDTLGNNLGSWNDVQQGQSVCVKLSGNYPVILGRMLLLPTTLPVSVQVVMRSEAN